MRSTAQIGQALRTSVLELGVRSLAGTVGVQFAILMCGTLTGLLTARMLGPAGRGELAAIIVWPTALSALLTLGMNQALAYRTGKHPERAGTIFATSLWIGAAQGILALVLGAVLAAFTSRHLAAGSFRSSLIYLVGVAFFIAGGYPANVFQGLGRMREFNWLRFLPVGLYAAMLLTLFAGRFGHNVRTILSFQVAAFAISAISGVVWLRREIAHPFYFECAEFRKIRSYALKAYAANCTGFLNQRVDQLILSLLVPSAQLGYYVVAVTLTVGLTFLPTALANLVMARATQESETLAATAIRRSLLLTSSVFGVVCLGFYAALPKLVALLFGDVFMPSVAPARILVPGIFMLGTAQVLYSGANAIGNPEIPSYSEACGLVLTSAGLLIAVPRWGYIGAAWISTIAYTCSLLISIALLWRKVFVRVGIVAEAVTYVESV